jgi:hypothetical protein
MIEVENPRSLFDKKPRPEHGCCVAIDDRRNEVGYLGRIVLEIGVLYYDNVASGVINALLYCRGFAAVSFTRDQNYSLVGVGK